MTRRAPLLLLLPNTIQSESFPSSIPRRWPPGYLTQAISVAASTTSTNAQDLVFDMGRVSATNTVAHTGTILFVMQRDLRRSSDVLP